MAVILKVKYTLKEGMLGTTPSDPNVYGNYIASKAPTPELAEEEVDALQEMFDEETDDEKEERPMTMFKRNEDGQPYIYDYMIKGFFKDACGGLRGIPSSKSSKLTAYKKAIDKNIFVEPRKIVIQLSGETTIVQRPLRTSGPKGERTAIAVSEEIPAGSTFECTLLLLNKKHLEIVREWLNYGRLSGLGQWRNSGKGQFTWEEISVEEVDDLLGTVTPAK